MNLAYGATIVDMNLLIQMITAAAVAYAAFMAHHARTAAKGALDVAVKSQETMQKLEINTNSMREQLVKSTGDERFAAGKEEARLEGEVKAAAIAEGQRTPLPPTS
jgi:hypothetical protein